jgi:hypothetical protein
MKLSTLLLLFAAAASLGMAQVVTKPDTPVPAPKAGSCPVVLTSAQMTPYLLLLRSSDGSSAGNPSVGDPLPGREPGIDLHFRNASGKEIRSVEINAEFLAKESIYDLRAKKIDLHLSAQGTQNIDETLEHLRHLPLPARTHPVVLNHIALEQVTFTDGSVWSPAKDDACGFSPNGSQQIVAR